MAIRQTSIDTYHKISSEGLLSKRRLEVLESIIKFGRPGTSAEIYRTMNTTEKGITQSRARFTELERMGVICEVDKRACSVTGITATVWDLTDNLPTKLERVTTKKEKVSNALEAFNLFCEIKGIPLDEDCEDVIYFITSI
jgi:hypothetical protein